jgi:hypothetical protein
LKKSAENRLKQFQADHNVVTKGPLALLVQLTRAIRSKEFPLNSNDFLTENKGQVLGLGGGNLKKILKDHGITQTLAAEGGRTSRGNMGLMMKYIEFLNEWNENDPIDFEEVENFWTFQIREYFRNQPFVLNADSSRTIGASLDELFAQARTRQKQNPGTQYLGAMLQHLVAAKLSIILPKNTFEIHGASVADSSTFRSGDFVIHKTIIHCTTSPGEPLMDKCKDNLKKGYLPLIITIFDRVKTACDLAADSGISGRIEIWDIQQFLSTNINEHCQFDEKNRNIKLADIIENYNRIINEKETDPSLRIEFETK